ncbi:MAG: 5-(carboxyamino)imidazole ribonucleotide mutase [Gammaproteobacteria bacterium]|nr:5-(carboxyamino)imidazole ribonucleotide mutase [Gammaproteobacteria bacterium]MDA8007541.1 5-(carboxyamino)imidazole ribonucleotide mutase [Gammaproteobacteria bacterium]MDA8011690.1 5-(carboxyamino)imidazole ribonucleotide mutase [Gammaproteobacteria bacterium]MDA8014268.1 5-(carboxyamino)imidazole ribonucleotide mutase [Gammaproteobacteria bacterium]
MSKNNQPFAAVLVGSKSDLPAMQATFDALEKFGVRWEARVSSAHRTPDITRRYVRDAEERGCAVFIAAAGLAAHLAGAVAAHSIRPVIGVPMEGGALNGHDALLATVQMPGGVPVACVAIGRAGAVNAANLAAQIMALGDKELESRVRALREANAEAVVAADRELQKNLPGAG